VARYGKDHKRQTRERIVGAAGRRLKADGIDGSGVSTLMADAGLTNGAFYAHFASKQDLVGAAVSEQLLHQAANFRDTITTPERLAQFVRDYLSTEHRDHRGDGCASAALVEEIGRCDVATRRAYTDALLILVDEVAALISSGNGAAARVRTLSAYALLVGSIQLSRCLTDPGLADAILEEGARNAMLILELPQDRRGDPHAGRRSGGR
jgi:TetR/AcrR family transcriptional regulator, transcriptional repressor for nem operon